MAGGIDEGALFRVHAYLEYLRDLGVYDFYRREGVPTLEPASVSPVLGAAPKPQLLTSEQLPVLADTRADGAPIRVVPAEIVSGAENDIVKPVSFNDLAPLPEARVPAAEKAAALRALQAEIGDCTRCPLAYAGRRTVVFADGDPNARLMFIGEGPGADEDAQGLPFVGKSGQLLNNMIAAMGLARESVYIANIVKCRPPNNRAPEPVEARTCSQFLLRQIDIVQPDFVVGLGATAATYLLGVRQSLAALRGRFHPLRGARLAITFHPAFLLRDPRQKGEAWKDLQMVMAAMGLRGKPGAGS